MRSRQRKPFKCNRKLSCSKAIWNLRKYNSRNKQSTTNNWLQWKWYARKKLQLAFKSQQAEFLQQRTEDQLAAQALSQHHDQAPIEKHRFLQQQQEEMANQQKQICVLQERSKVVGMLNDPQSLLASNEIQIATSVEIRLEQQFREKQQALELTHSAEILKLKRQIENTESRAQNQAEQMELQIERMNEKYVAIKDEQAKAEVARSAFKGTRSQSEGRPATNKSETFETQKVYNISECDGASSGSDGEEGWWHGRKWVAADDYYAETEKDAQ